MAVKLSREPGLFSVLLDKPAAPDVGLLAPLLAQRVSITRSDAVRALRQQRGIILEGLSAERAEAARELLSGEGMEPRVVADAVVPAQSKALEIALARLDEHCFETPSLQGAGLPQLWPWEHLVVAVGGLIIDARAQAERLTSGLENGLIHEAEVRKAQAQRMLEKSRLRVFPLSTELGRDEPQLAEALASAQRARLARAKGEKPAEPALEGEFGRISTRLDLFFTRPFERLRVTEKSHVQELQRSALPAKQLHTLAATLAQKVPAEKLAPSTWMLAAGSDSGEYLFDDGPQFDDYCRWCLWRAQQ
ncbi:MAG: hypothetical protein HPKKFMNG_02340 [Planctomycetes bacterium]|nr:hypothetical protein [Planctomycetota bacterium]